MKLFKKTEKGAR